MSQAEAETEQRPPDVTGSGAMVFIPGGTFRMGSDHHYPEEAPSHGVSVESFWIDRTPVTNRQFKEFVKATGHVSTAQVPPEPRVRWCSCRRTALPISVTGASGGPS